MWCRSSRYGWPHSRQRTLATVWGFGRKSLTFGICWANLIGYTRDVYLLRYFGIFCSKRCLTSPHLCSLRLMWWLSSSYSVLYLLWKCWILFRISWRPSFYRFHLVSRLRKMKFWPARNVQHIHSANYRACEVAKFNLFCHGQADIKLLATSSTRGSFAFLVRASV